ncbi:MAG: hypothetical protein M0027_12605 [Candidatus Dormibacteraeota bacterium]|nr:hypothetical protein [Candidatus Dormibacteraeota bacterium]
MDMEHVPAWKTVDEADDEDFSESFDEASDEDLSQSFDAAARPTVAERVSRVQLRTDQEVWVRRLLSEAMAAGVHVAEADVLRVAIDRLRAGGAGWPGLRVVLTVEATARTQRRAVPAVSRRGGETAG